MEYPTFKAGSAPTPSDKLEICDKCQRAFWTIHVQGQVSYCYCGSRKREATKREYEIAKKELKLII